MDISCFLSLPREIWKYILEYDKRFVVRKESIWFILPIPKHDMRYDILYYFYLYRHCQVEEYFYSPIEIKFLRRLFINQNKIYSLVFEIETAKRYVHFIEYYHSTFRSHRSQILLEDY
jgi:hypothetical protein